MLLYHQPERYSASVHRFITCSRALIFLLDEIGLIGVTSAKSPALP